MPRVSLRELFALIAASALGLLSLIYASFFWQATVSFIVILAGIASVILSLVDSGPRRAFAIGFAVAMLGYLLVVLNAPKFSTVHSDTNVELDPYEGVLPTSVALRYFYDGISHTNYFDAYTGRPIPASQSDGLVLVQEGTGALPTGGFSGPISVPAGKRAAVYDVHPTRENFMPIGHFWWALAFGYIGGKFALIVFERRKSADSAAMA